MSKISAQSNNSSERFVIKFEDDELKALGWESKDIIRVISKKKENKIILKKVNKKYSKQVAYTLTSTGSGEFSCSKGLFVKYGKNRFSAPPKNGSSAICEKNIVGNKLELTIPQEVLAF